MGNNVPGNIDARYRTAPNSKTREFHVERKWEMYRRRVIDGGMGGVVSSGGSLSSSFRGIDDIVCTYIIIKDVGNLLASGLGGEGGG